MDSGIVTSTPAPPTERLKELTAELLDFNMIDTVLCKEASEGIVALLSEIESLRPVFVAAKALRSQSYDGDAHPLLFERLEALDAALKEVPDGAR